MAENSKIEWCDHTFNPWIGCTKVGPGCDNCYAKADFEDRKHRVVWGAGQARSLTKTWGDPVRWNKQHAAFFAEHGRRQRVFCASLADVFDNEVPRVWRYDLLWLISNTPNLDWLLLTKRIGNASAMLESECVRMGFPWSPERWPNAWLGATIVNQEEADRDIPKLLAVPAAKRFLSMEPLLGPVDISKYIDPWTCSNCGHWGGEADSGPCKCADGGVESVYDESIGSDRCPQCGKDNGTSDDVGPSCPNCEQSGGWERDNGFKFDSEKKLIDWVIFGGESGPKARPMHPDWARSLRDQCQAAGVPFLFKQWGEWEIASASNGHLDCDMARNKAFWIDRQGACHKPSAIGLDNPYAMIRVGKKFAGRTLDGREWNGVPA